MNAIKQAQKNRKTKAKTTKREQDIAVMGWLKGIDIVKAVVCEYLDGEIDQDALRDRLVLSGDDKHCFKPNEGIKAK